jgi:predicted DNA-binding antitoxin AbrB/MazE fold protein
MMKVIRALYDGRSIKPLESVDVEGNTEVIVVFPNTGTGRIESGRARRLLRGSGKGENLTERLIKSRREDLSLEKKN